jgi:PAS domain S-box-containing protein
MISITVTTLIMGIALFVNEYRTIRQSLANNLEMQAAIIGHNTSAALLFLDRSDAEKTLSALSAQRQIRQAILYDANRDIFAEYRETNLSNVYPPAIIPAENEQVITPEGIGLFYRVTVDGKTVGTVYIETDMAELRERLIPAMIIMSGVFLFSLLLGYVLVVRLQGSIANPINQLVASMNAVATDRNYAVRVNEASSDELGVLAGQFNYMLAEIERRDNALQEHRDMLEYEVAMRTRDLKLAKDMLERELQERRAAESARQESELRYRTLFESSADAILILEVEGPDEGEIISANEAAATMHGYSPDELVGMNVSRLYLQAEANQEVQLRAAVRAGGQTTVEARHVRKDGSVFPVEVTANLFSSIGRRYMLAVDRDLSERKRAEQKRLELEDRLHRAQKMEALGLMAGGVAHDLNNLLSGVVGYPDLLLMQLPPESPLRKSLQAIKASGERAADIVQDLLTLARRGVVEEAVVNMNTIIHDYLASPAVEALRQRIPRVKIVARYDESLLNVIGSAAHFSKTIMNLVTNAAEAVAGTGEVMIETQNIYIEQEESLFPGMREGDYVLLQIKDTGEGMEEEDLARIFEPFFSTKGMGQSGTGLGLAIVWGVVQDYKGFIDVKSTRGQGTTFSIYIPATRRQPELAGESVSAESLRGNGETVLVVDDLEEQRTLAVEILTQLGYSAVAVSGGEEAVAYVEKHHVNLAMLDMIMPPGIDGLETYRRILQIKPSFRALLVSGFSESERVKEAQRLGAGMYLKKPYVIQRLGLALKRELE